MKHLYFCRHGLSEMNKLGLWAGQTETPLAEEGKLQAKLAGEKANELAIDKIISSPYERAHDTAKIIADAIGYPLDHIELNSLFIERHFGALEGTPWQPDLNLDGFADIETFDTLFERCKLGFEFLLALPQDNVLLVSHGSTGRMLRHVIHPDIPFERTELSKGFGNAEIVQLL
ncbi:MAG TPA: histidine phosphatase family protein [Candidatus Saccharimonadales bacterium]|nr:histidine phosphatase family protein [Candidatus Saccharimonadales bacterium]